MVTISPNDTKTKEINYDCMRINKLKKLAKKDLPKEAESNYRLLKLFDFMDKNGKLRPDNRVNNIEVAATHFLFDEEAMGDVTICSGKNGELILTSLFIPQILEKGWKPIKNIENRFTGEDYIVREYDELGRQKHSTNYNVKTGNSNTIAYTYNKGNKTNEPDLVEVYENEEVQKEKTVIEYLDPEKTLLKKMTETIIKRDKDGNAIAVVTRVITPVYDKDFNRIDTKVKEKEKKIKNKKH